MKKLLLLFTLLCFSTLFSAQTTVTDAIFPVAGDTLKTATDLMPSGIEITAPGGDFQWDFSSLNATTTSEVVYLDASAGSVAAEVPLATHVTIDPNTGAESYYRVTSDEISLVAANGQDPVGAGIDAIFRFEPPIIEQRAPMTFPANNDSESNLNIAFAWDDLPAFITDSIPTIIVPDSIRIRVTQTRNDFVDAWGTLAIPGDSYDVLREKRTLERDTRLEVLVEIPFLGFQWQDVTDLLTGGGAGGGLFEGLGFNKSITYNFYSNDAKEAIAVVTMDSTETNATRVVFKNNNVVSSTGEVELLPVNVSPNPISDLMRVELGNFPEGQFTLTIFNLQGSLLFEKNMNVVSGHVETLDISHLPNGNHIFQIADHTGQLFASGKIMKI